MSALAAWLLAALLCAAVVTDSVSRRIPNLIVLSGLSVALLLGAVGGGQAWPAAVGVAMFGAMLGAATLLPLYLLKGCAAGDVKLMAMVGSFVGPWVALMSGVYTYIAGGVLALVFLFRPGVLAHTVLNLRQLFGRGGDHPNDGRKNAGQGPIARTAARLPYAVAIAVGTAAAVWMAPAGFVR